MAIEVALRFIDPSLRKHDGFGVALERTLRNIDRALRSNERNSELNERTLRINACALRSTQRMGERLHPEIEINAEETDTTPRGPDNMNAGCESMARSPSNRADAAANHDRRRVSHRRAEDRMRADRQRQNRMLALWNFIRRHPTGFVLAGLACVAPLHAAFVQAMHHQPSRAPIYGTLMWLVPGSMVLASFIAMGANAFQSRAKKAGRCPTCGYDLRATPDRCPECGTDVKPPMDAEECRP